MGSHDPLLYSVTAEEYYSPIAQRGKQSLIHWIYYPDSYDSWVPANDVSGAPEPTPEPPKQWLVSIPINALLL